MVEIEEEPPESETTTPSNPPMDVRNNLKAVYFFLFASSSTLGPFLSTYFDMVGLRGDRIGIIGAVRPIVGLIANPWWGATADRSHRHLELLMLTFGASALCNLGYLCFQQSFTWFLLVSVVKNFFFAPVKVLLDSIALSMLSNTDNNHYGRCRVFGQWGNFLMTVTVALFAFQSTASFERAFAISVILALPALISINFMRESFKETILSHKKEHDTKQQQSDATSFVYIIKKGSQLLRTTPGVGLFFSVVMICGATSGFMEHFAYIRMRQLNVTGGEMSFIRTLFSIGAISGYYNAGNIINRVGGADRILVASLLLFGCTSFFYGAMTNSTNHPVNNIIYIGGLADFLRGLSFAVFWSCSTIKSNELSPPGLKATFMAVLETVYRGFGYTLGSFTGGKLVSSIGFSQTAYQFAALNVFAAFVLLSQFYSCLTTTSSNNHDKQRAKESLR